MSKSEWQHRRSNVTCVDIWKRCTRMSTVVCVVAHAQSHMCSRMCSRMRSRMCSRMSHRQSYTRATQWPHSDANGGDSVRE